MIEIRFEKEKNRSAAYDNDIKIGECDYIVENNVINIIHTGVNSHYQGQGIARKLVDCIIENAKVLNMDVTAECSYAKKILDK